MRTRVSWICALVSLAIATAATAAAPPLLPLQGVLTDADGVPLATAVSIRFSLHTTETGGSEVWYETQTVTPVDGLFAAYLGQGTGGTMTLATFRDEGQLWLEVKVGSDDPMARVRLASVGYAGYAEYCGNVPAHTHPAGDLPAGVVIGAQTCSGSDKVRGVSSSGAIVCSPDLGTGPDTLGQLSCTTGQTVKWNGAVWGCANDDNSGGTITAVNVGSGLSGNTVGTVATLSLSGACSATEVLRFDGSAWQCTPAVGSLATPAAGGLAFTTTGATYNLTLKTGCANGQVLKYNGVTSSWDCAADANSGDITDVLVATGGGLSVTNSGGPQPTLALQACQTTGQVLKWDATGSAWGCASDADSGGDITAVLTPNGSGLTGGVSSGSASLSLAACNANQVLRSAGSSWGCVDDVTAVNTPSTGGLTGGGAAGALSLKVKDCTAGQVLKSVGTGWDCGADNNSGGTVSSVATGAGLTGGPVTTSGTISILTGGVTNAMLANSDLTVTAGAGLGGGGAVELGGATTLNVDFTGSTGTATTAARSDHNHTGAYWAVSGNAGTNPVTDYVGTRDSQPLEVRVNGSRALRLEPNATAPNLVGGHYTNAVTAGVVGAVIGGGGTSGSSNRVTADHGTVAGGLGNQVGDSFDHTTATVGGGSYNTASGLAAVVAGGAGNAAVGAYSSIAGGLSNSASGYGFYASIGGGQLNVASGDWSMVPGGRENTASGWYSFAAGRRAHSAADGCFVWGDSTDADVTSSGPNQFVARAVGGVTFWTGVDGSNNPNIGATLGPGASAWGVASDRNLKQDFTPVDPRVVLAKVASMPVSIWRYKTETSRALHMGPVAQDFYAAFGLGPDERLITTVDADGVALAAIKGLHQADGELRAENEQLRAQVRTLESRVAQLGTLEQRLAKLEQAQTARGGAGSFGWGAFGLIVAGGLVVARRRRGN